MVKFFPNEAADLEPVLDILLRVQSEVICHRVAEVHSSSGTGCVSR